MLLFDVDLLEAGTKGDPYYLVIALEHFWQGRKFPKNIKEQYKPLKNLRAGSSFLLNPAKLFQKDGIDLRYKAQYLRLAAKRSFMLYKQTRQVTLDLTLYPDLDLAAIKSNPLLTIANKQLHFKYES